MLLCSWQSLEPVPKQMQPGDSVHVSLLWHLTPDVFSLAQAPVEPWALSRVQLEKNPNVLQCSCGEKILCSCGYRIIVLLATGKARCREAWEKIGMLLIEICLSWGAGCTCPPWKSWVTHSCKHNPSTLTFKSTKEGMFSLVCNL